MSVVSIIIVADIFANFAAQHESVITYSDLVRRLARLPRENDLLLIPGQGLDAQALRTLTRQFELPGVQVLEPIKQLPRAGHKQAHKHRPHNILVSLARRLDPRTFELDMHFDTNNEFFQDHMTGQHIQGMVIMEAMRQSFLTVTEQYYLHTANQAYYFVIHDMSVKFEKFLFPIDAHLTYKVQEEKMKDGRYNANVHIVVEQAGQPCAVGTVGFTAFDAALIESRERSAAQEVLVKHLSKLSQYWPEKFGPSDLASDAELAGQSA